MLASYDYDAFGNQKDVVENIYNPFRYCGEYADEESGLIYLRARYYEPSSGRFISEDPAKDGMNWYVYCANDPVNFVDPSGYLRAPGYTKDGTWSDNPDAYDFGYGSATYKMLSALTNAYNLATDYSVKASISYTADALRNTDKTITDVILLNDSEGAHEQGHNAVLLLNSSGQGFYFSYYSENGAPYGDAECDFAVLTADQVNGLKDRDGGVIAITSKGDRVESSYDRFVWNDVSTSNGRKIFAEAVNVFSGPGKYNLAGNQCDNIASQILSAGNAGYTVQWRPNKSYEVYSQGRTHWSNKLGKERGI